MGRLTLGPLVAVDAEFGVVGEVAAELDEEGTEVPVDAVEVVVVHEGGGRHDPGIGPARLGVPPLLGSERGRLLLGLAHEEHPFVALKALQVLVGDVVLALALGEGDEVDPLVVDEALDVLHEPLGDRVHEGRGGEAEAQVAAEEAHHAGCVLELRDIEVQVHPVDALNLQGYVLGQHIAHGSGYGHLWAPVDRPYQTGNQPLRAVHRWGRQRLRP